MLIVTGFDHNGHQAIPQKLKKFGTYRKIVKLYGIKFTFILIFINSFNIINPLKPKLNPSAQRCLTRHFTGDFAS
jgi:hypothetical protein